MKNLSLTLIFLLIAMLIGCATIQVAPKSYYTYDGELDPVVFFDWEESGAVSWAHEDHFHVIVGNPEEGADVPAVEMILVFLGSGVRRIVAYRYTKNGIDYEFYLDDNGHYEQLVPEVIDKSGGV